MVESGDTASDSHVSGHVSGIVYSLLPGCDIPLTTSDAAAYFTEAPCARSFGQLLVLTGKLNDTVPLNTLVQMPTAPFLASMPPAPAVATQQALLDTFCRTQVSPTSVGRFGPGADTPMLAWRCYEASALQFERDGFCVDEAGGCTLCAGQYDGLQQSGFSAVTVALAVPCQALQTTLDRFCNSRTVTFESVARFMVGSAQEGLFQWRCVSVTTLDFTLSGVCARNDGTCTACRGKRNGFSTQHLTLHQEIVNLIAVTAGVAAADVKCSAQTGTFSAGRFNRFGGTLLSAADATSALAVSASALLYATYFTDPAATQCPGNPAAMRSILGQGRSVEECVLECDASVDCTAAQMSGSDCHLFGPCLATPTSGAFGAPAGKALYSRYRSYSGLKCADVAQLADTAVTLQTCARACSAASGCFGFDFDFDRLACFQHTAACGSIGLESNSSFYAYVKQTANATAAPRPLSLDGMVFMTDTLQPCAQEAEAIANGVSSDCGTSTPHGALCLVKCAAGYAPSDVRLPAYRCLHGVWTTSVACVPYAVAPMADPNGCRGLPPTVNFGTAPSAACQFVSAGTTCPAVCSTGYQASGPYVCEAGSWRQPVCVRERVLSCLLNGSVTGFDSRSTPLPTTLPLVQLMNTPYLRVHVYRSSPDGLVTKVVLQSLQAVGARLRIDVNASVRSFHLRRPNEASSLVFTSTTSGSTLVIQVHELLECDLASEASLASVSLNWVQVPSGTADTAVRIDLASTLAADIVSGPPTLCGGQLPCTDDSCMVPAVTIPDGECIGPPLAPFGAEPPVCADLTPHLGECIDFRCRTGYRALDVAGVYRCIDGCWLRPACVPDVDFVFVFDSTTDHVIRPQALGGTSLTQFVMCTWLVAAADSGYIASYATATHDNEMALVIKSGELAFFLKNVEYTLPSLPFALNNQWHHLCVAWQGQSLLHVFADGQFYGSTDVPNGTVIDGSGTLVLGNDQDVVGGGFDPLQQFFGTLSQFNIYANYLGASTIKGIYLHGHPNITNPGSITNRRSDHEPVMQQQCLVCWQDFQ